MTTSFTHEFGLLGRSLGHSFSPGYFNDKFEREGLSERFRYSLLEIPDITGLPALLESHPQLRGFNVTIPYKEAVLAYLHHLSPAAEAIGAVNTVAIDSTTGQLTGYNTDVLGFAETLLPVLPTNQAGLQALILGTGGAAKAVAWVLKSLAINYQLVSRRGGEGTLSYAELTPALMSSHQLLVNTTPLGMWPAVDTCPDIPFAALTSTHILYDLVYNPGDTLFLRYGRAQGTTTVNGLPMLYAQAEAAWKIWMHQLNPQDEQHERIR